MNMESLWEQTCALLSREMNFVSYNTWIDGNMVPGLLEDDTLFITVKMERMISMIQNKYAALIEKKLGEVAGKPVRIVLLNKEEMKAKLDTGDTEKTPDDTDPHLNPKYTFESFVVGNGNRFLGPFMEPGKRLSVAGPPGFEGLRCLRTISSRPARCVFRAGFSLTR